MCVCSSILLILGLAGTVGARGVGIKAGSGRLHPALDLDLVYDTNAGYFSEDPISDLVLKIRPGVTLSFPSDKVSFELTGKVGYDYYFGIDNDRTTDLSTVAGDASMQLGFNPEGQVSFFIEDHFSRSGDPRYTSLSGRFDRTDNEAKAHLQIKPGGGALMFDLAYGFFIDWFDESSDFADADAYSSYAHRIYFSGKWKFLPKTAVTLDFDSDLRRYPNEASWGQNVDINAIRATLGLLGQITPCLSLSIRAGYGDTLLAGPSGYAGDDYRSVIGQAELTFRSGTTFIQGGYTRNFQPVVVFAYFGQDRVYARLRQQFAGKFSLSLDVAFDWLSYGTAVPTSTAAQGDRSDGLLYGGVSLDYHIQDWIEVGIAYDLQWRFSDWTLSQNSASVDYQKHMFTFHVGVDY